MIELRPLGSSGLRVSALGLGAGPFGRDDLPEAEAQRLLDGALDLGITLIDTARSYGSSEERLGRYLGPRRHQVVLSTKGGYGIDGVEDWTPASVARGIDEALARLRTDWIDVFHLHSCALEVLARDEVLAELDRALKAGKIRAAAYSGENDALFWAARSGRFSALQCSLSPFDQRSLDAVLPHAASRALGIIAKRPLANAPWRASEAALGEPEERYRVRMERMNVDPAPFGWVDFCLRFAVFSPGVSSAIVGTTRLDHLRQNVEAIARGPLPEADRGRIRSAFASQDRDWEGIV